MSTHRTLIAPHLWDLTIIIPLSHALVRYASGINYGIEKQVLSPLPEDRTIPSKNGSKDALIPVYYCLITVLGFT